jgi:hypothetical protein
MAERRARARPNSGDGVGWLDDERGEREREREEKRERASLGERGAPARQRPAFIERGEGEGGSVKRERLAIYIGGLSKKWQGKQESHPHDDFTNIFSN